MSIMELNSAYLSADDLPENDGEKTEEELPTESGDEDEAGEDKEGEGLEIYEEEEE